MLSEDASRSLSCVPALYLLDDIPVSPRGQGRRESALIE